MEKNHGILLSALPYLGRKKILKVFTSEAGLISLIVNSPKLTSLSAPFCAAEWIYRKPQKELASLSDGTLLDGFVELRSSYEKISAAGAIANDLLRSQLPCKPTPLLYELLFAYFRKLGTSLNPEALATSFRLKLLIHDGLLRFTSHCTLCNQSPLSLREGEGYCAGHGTGGVFFTSEEWDKLLLLAYSKQFSILEQVRVSDAVLEKTKTFFQERIV